MASKFELATDWILRRRWLTAACLVLVSLVALGGYWAPESVLTTLGLKADVEVAEPPADSGGPRSVDVAPNRPNSEGLSLTGYDVIMVVQSDRFFTPDGTEAIRSVVKRLESLDYVDEVLWMDRVPVLNLFGLGQPLLPRARSADVRYDLSRQQARSHPLVNGQLMSEDGRTLLLMIRIDFLFVMSDEVFLSGMKEIAQSEAARFPGVPMEFFVTGKVPVNLVARRAHEANRLKYQIIAYGMIFLLSTILFRGIVAVIVVAIAPTLAVFWTLGLVRYFDLQLNPFNDVVLPVLVALVAFTDGVHLMVQIRTERATGLGPVEAARQGIRKVGMACFLTSLTTAVGFGSLVLADHDLVREFGFCCVFGVALAFVAVLLSIPLSCSTWLGKRIHVGYGKGYIDRNLGKISLVIDFVLKHYRAISVSGVVVTLVCFAISLTLRPDDRPGDLLPRSSEPATAMRVMDSAMGGLEQARLEITWAPVEGQPENVAVLLGLLHRLDDVLSDEPLIGHPISLYNLLDALPGDGPAEGRASMVELLPTNLKRAFYQPEQRSASVNFRVQDLGIAVYGPVFQRIQREIETIGNETPGFTVTLAGNPIWRWENIYQIVVDLGTSLITAAIVIFGILSLVYRSLRIGLISLLPNLFPLSVAGVYLVVTGQALEVVTVCAFTCCLGIAVDDTIHFLTRYVEEKERVADESEAITRAFTAVGTALVMTTLVLVAGFTTVLFSEAREHRIFASMGAITVAAALFGDLVFLPAVLKRYAKPSKANQTGSEVAETPSDQS